jgi:integrase
MAGDRAGKQNRQFIGALVEARPARPAPHARRSRPVVIRAHTSQNLLWRLTFIELNRVVAGPTIKEKEPKTETSRRELPLDPGLVAALRRAKAQQAADKLQYGSEYCNSGYVAVDGVGRPYRPDSLTRMWTNVTKAAGVKHIKLHEARHSCGTAMHLRKVPLAVIAAWLGHHDASITARIYTHSQPQALSEASAILGQIVSSE